MKDHMVYYAGPGQEAGGSRVGVLRAHDGRQNGFIRRHVSVSRW